MWHASVSLRRRNGRWLVDEQRVERAAIRALAGVGGDVEWWVHGLALVSSPGVGHLRVPTTPMEWLLIPPSPVTTDAGETGPQRPRSFA